MDRTQRASAFHALGDETRLQIVDALAEGDHTVTELGSIAGVRGNLLAHHLDILEGAGLITRRTSEGDRRRKYVSLEFDALPSPVVAGHPITSGTVAFVCTANSARSQFAARLWTETTGGIAVSAGSHPAEQVHPLAIAVAKEMGVDLTAATPGGYERIADRPGTVVTVCDRARETDLPESDRLVHWSVPDPVPSGDTASFREAFREISRRVELHARRPR